MSRNGRKNKYCVVPNCESSSRKTPDKRFISLPADLKMRHLWQVAMGRTEFLSNKGTRSCCEDHFNLKEDSTNYLYQKLMKSRTVRLKPGVIPHIFKCQNRPDEQEWELQPDDSASATGRSNTRLELPIQGPSGQGAEASDTFLELPSTSNRPDSVSATGRSNTRLEVPLQGPSRQGAEPSDTFLELPSTSSGPVTKRRRKNIDSYEDDSTSDSSKPIEMPIDDRGTSGHLQCQSDENMSDSDSLIDIIKHEIDIPEDVPDSVTSQELETVMINDDDDDSQSTHNIEEIRMKEEPSKQNDFDDRHPIDVFCKSVALSLKSLRMDLCNEGKIRIMQLISELEQRNSLPSEGPSTSKSSNNYAEPTSTVTKYLVPKKEFD